MSGSYGVDVYVESPARGTGQQQPFYFRAQTATATWSWGLQPATCMIDWASFSQQPSVIPLSLMTIKFSGGLENGGQTFWGLVNEATPVLASDGVTLLQKFVDLREFLQWDIVQCRFNRAVKKLVNGQYVKFYEHILPADYAAGRCTYTDTPYWGNQILDFLFNAPTVGSPWVRFYHFNLLNPIYELDWESGIKLGTAVQIISERLGTVFTMMGAPYWLVWTVKGVGALPPFPPDSDQRRGPGSQLSGHPSRIQAIGDRNVYEVLNIEMLRDWNSNYEDWVDPNHWYDFVFENFATESAIGGIAQGTPYNAVPGDTYRLIGYQLAKARALTLTLSDMVNLFGNNLADTRKFAGRSRMSMPVFLYVQTLVYRAFRPPVGFSILNAHGFFSDVFSINMLDRAVVEVSHDPTTGDMFWELDVVTNTNGYAIVQGYQVGQDAFKTLHPERFNIGQWVNSQTIWTRVPFQIDDSGEGNQFIIFDQAVVNSGDLILQPSFSGTLQAYPMLNYDPTITVPPVQAALIFAAERFTYLLGAASKDEVQSVPGLNGEYVGYYQGGSALELPYADGQKATQKADAILEPLLGRQFYYQTGGYQIPRCGTQLASVIDRVTVRTGPDVGLVETVDLTNERATNADASGNLILDPERRFERREQLQPLLPGQRELREEAAKIKADAIALKQSPRMAKLIADTFDELYGYDAQPAGVPLFQPLGQFLPGGTPLWRTPSQPIPTSPGPSVNVSTPIFVGVTTRDSTPDTGLVAVTANGVDGVLYARVMGPVSSGDAVGYDNVTPQAQSWLVDKGSPSVGTALEAIASAVVKLIRIRPLGGGGSGSVNYRGLYDNTKQYFKYDVVRVQTGLSQGVWICVVDNLAIGTPPVFPEPVTTGGSNNWDMFSFGVQASVDCGSGTSVSIFTQSSQAIN